MDTGNKDQVQMDPQKHRNVCNYVLILVLYVHSVYAYKIRVCSLSTKLP